jgi:hypothetical protein
MMNAIELNLKVVFKVFIFKNEFFRFDIVELKEYFNIND